MPRAEDYDEFCDPENPNIVTVEDITQAADEIRPYVTYTPCIREESDSSIPRLWHLRHELARGANHLRYGTVLYPEASHYQKDFVIHLYYKMEQFQQSGSFKLRGAVNYLRLLPMDKKKAGIVVASLGNDAISLCHYASKINVPVTVVLPNTICISKAQRCHELGGKVLVHGNNLIESQKFARAIARQKGQTYLNSRDHPQLLAGYGTIGLEILEQLPYVDAVIVPVGSGGLVSAVASIVKQAKPMCLVYGVQAESMPVFFKALEEGDPLTIPVQETEADSLVIQLAGVNALHTARPLVDKMLLVKEDWIAQSILHLVEKERLVVEGGGACSLAAIIGNLVPELKTKHVVCVLTGGNIDAYSLSRCVDRGLAVEARLIKFSVGVKDTPGAPTQLMRLLAAGGYNVVHQLRNREWVDDDVYNIEFKLVCETQGLEHALDLKRLIERAYPCSSAFETEPFNDKTTCPCYVKRVKNIC